MSALLLKQIVVLFLMMGLGALLVRLRLLKSEDSRVLSLILIYIVVPCVIVRSFQIEFTPEVRDGFLLALGAGALIHVLLYLLTRLCRRFFGLDAVEQGSVMYSNSGSLIIPLVTAVLGEEWIIYASAFTCVQLVVMWTHGCTLISGEKHISWKKILLNINLIAVAVGLLLLVLCIRLPGLLRDAMGQISATVGPVSMIMIGMLLADVNWKELLASKRLYLITLLKMVGVPLAVLLFLRLSGLAALAPEGKTILYISFLAVITPSATTVTQLAQIYRNRPDYSSAINAITTVVCLATMPMMTWVFEKIM